MKITINRKRCKGCRLCIIFCPKKNIALDKALNESGVSPAVIITEENCTGCGICFLMCPDCCIEVNT